MNNNSTQQIKPLKWFEDRVGSFVFRAPIFDSEKGRDFVAFKVRDKHHAFLLHGLQRQGRAPYSDNRNDFELSSKPVLR